MVFIEYCDGYEQLPLFHSLRTEGIMDEMNNDKDKPNNEGADPSDNTGKKRSRYARKKKPDIVFDDLRMAALMMFERLEFATYESAHHMLAIDFPDKREREIDDAVKELHDLEYARVIPRDTHLPNVLQLDKRGMKMLVDFGVDREKLSVYTGSPGYLAHKEQRDYFCAALTHALNEGHTDMEAWEREYLLEVPKTRTAPKITFKPDAIMRIPNRRGGKNRLPLEVHTGSQFSARIMGDKISRHLIFHKNLPATDGPDMWRSLFIAKTEAEMKWLISLARESPNLWFHHEAAFKQNYQNSLAGWMAGDGSTHMLTE